MDYIREIVEYGVIGTLIFMSFVSLFFSLERVMFYASLELHEYENKKILENILTKNLTIISTIGANAPYVGLLGTVLSIMLTFMSIGENGLTNTGELMLSLALALKATAIGLGVAIPSIIFYNLLSRKAETMLNSWEALRE